MTLNEKLTVAFNAGYTHRHDGGNFSRRLRIDEKVRHFWEAGYEKAEKEIKAEREAYKQTPEYKEAQRKEAADMMNMFRAVGSLAIAEDCRKHGEVAEERFHLAQASKHMNEVLGI